MARFTGKAVIVTGAGSGFGAAIARRFAQEGAGVLVADIDGAATEEVAASIGSAALALDRADRGAGGGRVPAGGGRQPQGVFLGVKYAIPALRRRGGGVILNTASIGVVTPRPGSTLYNATKGAVVTLTRSLAAELAAGSSA